MQTPFLSLLAADPILTDLGLAAVAMISGGFTLLGMFIQWMLSTYIMPAEVKQSSKLARQHLQALLDHHSNKPA